MEEKTVLDIRQDFNDFQAIACSKAVGLFEKTGLRKADAQSRVVHMLLRCAAIAAIENRAVNLSGDPDINKWRQASDKIFTAALERHQRKG